ncbi:conserved hypothetical protein [Ricinus communis]|uniref:LOB domain-containing protein n=1 Tax=Ricinus communis TaxID=3988 RepID=B9R928_RICCO|nr:conserved hypothetical protein [Ricinus communis]
MSGLIYQKNAELILGLRQAYASCEYQARKCSSGCPLAPYFPPDQEIARNLIIWCRKESRNSWRTSKARTNTFFNIINLPGKYRRKVSCSWACFICQLHYQIRQAEKELHSHTTSGYTSGPCQVSLKSWEEIFLLVSKVDGKSWEETLRDRTQCTNKAYCPGRDN